MGRRLAPLTLDTLPDLPDPCRKCVVWELEPVAADRAAEAGDTAFEKEAWVSATLLEWGSCGRVAYVDDDPAGFVLYAPPKFVPRSLAFPTSPVSPDAVLLMTARVLPEHTGGGLARMLVQAAAKDLTRRGVRAVEAFGYVPEAHEFFLPGDRLPGCLVPADLLLAVGFKTVRQHHRYPRLRLELKTALSWREDVEQALERILGSVRQPALASSVSTPGH
jgi:GNAT superfamily N-acetyltransferase